MNNNDKLCSLIEFDEQLVTTEALLAKCTAYLKGLPHVLQPFSEATWLLQYLLGRGFSYSDPVLLTKDLRTQLEDMLFERAYLAKPLAYILGTIPFLDLEILCEAPILIPRIETENWVVSLINELIPFSRQPLKILDLCTGTGCIALAIAKKFPKFEVLGVDIDPVAVVLAEKNKIHNTVLNTRFVQSDLFFNIDVIAMDVVVANPPYVTNAEYLGLPPSVKNWEAKHALVADDDGLCFYKKIISEVSLKKPATQGWPSLVLEMSSWQIYPVQQILANSGFGSKIVPDNYGQHRALFAWKY
jgi:release factor glutamine methyltransferase